MKGWLAFDIDGTITDDRISIPSLVSSYFKQLSGMGWKFVFLTGRSYTFSKTCLDCFDFDYYFSSQNGSLLMEMPSKEIIFKDYVHGSAIEHLEAVFHDLDCDFIVYKGMEFNDSCYFRPKRIPKNIMPYIYELQAREKEDWEEVDNFVIDSFPLAKCVGSLEQLHLAYDRLEKMKMFDISIIRDPFFEKTHILLVTNKGVCKGAALRRLTSRHEKSVIISAGNDFNDITLLEAGDIKIAMKNSPKELLSIANYIAPSAREMGIVTTLKSILSGV
jgi:Cof subfamily protein (haloacid dehalogenase superfamily)